MGVHGIRINRLSHRVVTTWSSSVQHEELGSVSAPSPADHQWRLPSVHHQDECVSNWRTSGRAVLDWLGRVLAVGHLCVCAAAGMACDGRCEVLRRGHPKSGCSVGVEPTVHFLHYRSWSCTSLRVRCIACGVIAFVRSHWSWCELCCCYFAAVPYAPVVRMGSA